jgi:hypothetical protein
MKKIALTVIGLVIVLYLIALIIPIDPDEQRPGTRLSGDWASEAPNWLALGERAQLQVQTHPWYGIPHSVTTTSFVVDGTLYVPCARCPTKRWPKNVAQDPQVVIKANGQLYAGLAERVTDVAILHAIFDEDHSQRDDVYLYQITPAPGSE